MSRLTALLFTTILLSALSENVVAQTPPDFQPGSSIRLGVAFPGQNINPAGTMVKSLQEVTTMPNVQIPSSALLAANSSQGAPARFAVFMLDIDAVVNGTPTTLLHWFQPDLIPQVPPVRPNSTSRVQAGGHVALREGRPLASRDARSAGAGPRLVAEYLPPAPPPGPAHRYVLALYAQQRNYSFPACYADVASPMVAVNRSSTSVTVDVAARVGFDVQEFARAAGLDGVPVAGNYFRVSSDFGPARARRAAGGTRSLKSRACGVTGAPAPAATTVVVTTTRTEGIVTVVVPVTVRASATATGVAGGAGGA